MFIYLITNHINSKQYVGQTIRTVEERWSDHKTLTKSKHHNALRSAIAKYGPDNFSVKVIDYANSIDELNIKEVYWIKQLKTLAPEGYNLENGGKNKKVHPSSKIKMSIAKKGKGHPQTLATRQKISNSKRGKPLSVEHRMALKAVLRSKIPVRCLNNNIVYACCKDAALALNLENEYVYRCIKGIQTHAKGFRFEVAIG